MLVDLKNLFDKLQTLFADMEDLKSFSKAQGAQEADDLNHWDTSFWSERLRESKYDINEVKSLSFSVTGSGRHMSFM